MKTYTTLNIAFTMTNSKTNEIVNILKIKKDGTNRIFFKPVNSDGVIVGRTLWARLCEAKSQAKIYLNRQTV